MTTHPFTVGERVVVKAGDNVLPAGTVGIVLGISAEHRTVFLRAETPGWFAISMDQLEHLTRRGP